VEARAHHQHARGVRDAAPEREHEYDENRRERSSHGATVDRRH
jgi:hypothetical protein